MNYEGVDFWSTNHHTLEIKFNTPEGELFSSGEILGKITPEVRTGKDFGIVLIQTLSRTIVEGIRHGFPLHLIVKVHHNQQVSYEVEIACTGNSFDIDYHTGYPRVSFRCIKIECNNG